MPSIANPLQVARSLLFTPGHLGRLYSKAAGSPADCLTLDLEDAVPAAHKGIARDMIRAALEAGQFAGRPILVRVNAFDSGVTAQDIDGVACRALDGFMYPMTSSADEIRALAALLEEREAALGLAHGHFCLAPVIETAAGVLNANAIATASPRLAGLLFGGEDYLADIDGQKDPDQWCFYTPRVQVVLAARAAGILPIDTPYVDIRDEAGFWKHCKRGRALGMAGVALMSPAQIATAHAIYSPSAEDVEQAEQMLDKLQETRAGGRGMTVQDGLYISPVGEKKARRILAQAAAIRAIEERRQA